MIKIAEVSTTKQGIVKIDFNQMGIYDFLKNTFGFRYTKIDGKGYYLKQDSKGIYQRVNFYDLPHSFLKYAENNMKTLPIGSEVDYEDFFNAFVEKSPVKNGNFCRDYLSEDFELSDYNLHLIRLEIDFDYKKKFINKEMLQFIKNEGFIETVDKVGNFAKNKPVYYKRLNEKQFIAINRPFVDDKNNDTNYDLWLVMASVESDFLTKMLDSEQLMDVRLGFTLERDVEIYRELQTDFQTNE